MDWMGRPEVAEALGVSEYTVGTLVKRGKLPAFQLTRRLLFRREDVAQVVENSRVGAAESVR